LLDLSLGDADGAPLGDLTSAQVQRVSASAGPYALPAQCLDAQLNEGSILLPVTSGERVRR